jgi:hypothetical protein
MRKQGNPEAHMDPGVTGNCPGRRPAVLPLLESCTLSALEQLRIELHLFAFEVKSK